MTLKRFDSRLAGGLALVLGALYLILSTLTGHSAAAEAPPDLSAKGAGLGVWKTLALLVEHPGEVAVIDVRPANRFELFRLPKAQSLPGAGAARVLEQAGNKPFTLVVAQKDADAAKLVGEVKKRGTKHKVHFLKGGARQWYLALELPVPLFSSKPAPFGYASSLGYVKTWLRNPAGIDKKVLTAAIGKLATIGFQPNLLAGKKKPAAGGKKKKIAGGCT